MKFLFVGKMREGNWKAFIYYLICMYQNWNIFRVPVCISPRNVLTQAKQRNLFVSSSLVNFKCPFIYNLYPLWLDSKFFPSSIWAVVPGSSLFIFLSLKWIDICPLYMGTTNPFFVKITYSITALICILCPKVLYLSYWYQLWNQHFNSDIIFVDIINRN